MDFWAWDNIKMTRALLSAVHTRKALPKLVLEASWTHGKVTKGIKRGSQEIVKRIYDSSAARRRLTVSSALSHARSHQ